MAILAGDALLTDAFMIASSAELPNPQDMSLAIGVLAQGAGSLGMVGGQVLDIQAESREMTEQEIIDIQSRKTGSLINDACVLGVIAGGGSEEQIAAAAGFAGALGMAFQIRDDMLDVVGDEEVFGKPIGSDREEGKVTFVDLRGLDGCARLVDECTARAKAAIADWPEHEFLFELADQMVGRTV